MPQGGSDKDAVVMRFRTQTEFWQFMQHAARVLQIEQGNQWLANTGLKIEVDPTAVGGVAFAEQTVDPGGGGDGADGASRGDGQDGQDGQDGRDGQDGAQLGPVVDTDPNSRDRMRNSAAEAREELARQQAREKPRGDAGGPAGAEAPRPRGRPRKARTPPEQQAAKPASSVTTEDQGGDGEISDRPADEAALNEPTDYSALDPKPNGAAKTDTPAETRLALIDVLRAVHELNRGDVETLVTQLGVKKLSQVPDDQVGELWKGTEALCAKYGVGFPPAGMNAP